MLDEIESDFDVCVVGGGMAGVCAAIASARNGARTALMHERPVLGGNASSEIRMHICGAHGKNNKETGILEEIQLENCHRNPGGNYTLWDSVLFEKVKHCDNLTTFLNCSCNDAGMDGDRIAWIRGWQMTTQTWHKLHAKIFIDCSGDSILAPLSGAHTRLGREARHEFNEDIAPQHADHKTMGNSLLLQLRETRGQTQYTPPKWAFRFDDETQLPRRIAHAMGQNFWWIELGGLNDTIRDAESIRDDLMATCYGVWDYMKNRSQIADKLRNWEIDWVGALPGKRENRRYIGAHTLTQNDIRSGGSFDDIIAYGGWSMDDHHPAGLLYPGAATLFHEAPSPYGIPYRCLFSENIANLMMAGRNISTTHVALSSTRVMGTCAILGQAAGSAAALCHRESCLPSNLYPSKIPELQELLMQDDCWLPGLKRSITRLTQEATLELDTGVDEGIRNGNDRVIGNELNGCQLKTGNAITFSWSSEKHVDGMRLVFDSQLSNPKRLPYRYPLNAKSCHTPPSLVKSFRVEGKGAGGAWQTLYRENDQHQRVCEIPIRQSCQSIRIIPEETHGIDIAIIHSIDLQETFSPKVSTPPQGRSWHEVMAQQNQSDLSAPDSGLEDTSRSSDVFGA